MELFVASKERPYRRPAAMDPNRVHVSWSLCRPGFALRPLDPLRFESPHNDPARIISTSCPAGGWLLRRKKTESSPLKQGVRAKAAISAAKGAEPASLQSHGSSE